MDNLPLFNDLRPDSRPISYTSLSKHNSRNEYHREYMRRRRGAPKAERYYLGAFGEAAVRQLLIGAGRRVVDQPSKARWDFLVDGWRVEVMTVSPYKPRPGYWIANFQRNGKLNEQADFYILRLVSPEAPIHLLLECPVGRKGIGIRMTPYYRERAAAFEQFLHGRFGFRPTCDPEIPARPLVTASPASSSLYPESAGGSL